MEWPEDKQLVVVIFAGRSGSKSLCALLCEQPDTIAIWENTGFFDQVGMNRPAKRLEFLAGQPYRIVVDCDFRWMWHLDRVLEIESAKIVYLYRDPELITESFWGYLKGEQSPLTSYPFYDFTANRAAILRTVSKYQMNVNQTGAVNKGRIIQVNVGQLNNMEKVDKLLDHLTVPKEGRKLKKHHIRCWGDPPGKVLGSDS